jgi:L-2-aminoadipate reductase
MTETQKKLAEIWSETLIGVPFAIITPDSNFFHLGGHSISAQQIRIKAKNMWKGVEIPISAILQHPTLEALAAEIDRTQDPTGLQLGAAGTHEEVTDEAYSADARNDLIKLLPTSFPSATLDFSKPKTVFLTGATGFLGSYILRDLMNRNMRVVAHARAKDSADGFARIEATTKAYGIWSESWRSQLEVVTGDLAKPKLGLSQQDWDKVASEVDVIIHNGALVNWMQPYSILRAANVLSTVDTMALCAVGKSKQYGFVSSTSTLDNEHYVNLSRESAAAGGKGVLETDDLEGSRKGLGTGYGQTKWASEYLIREAGKRGLKGAVVRPGYVTGDPVSGTSITDDFLVRVLKGCLQLKARPDIGNTVNQVPVTHVARVVVASTFNPPTEPIGVAQVTSDLRLTFNEFVGSLESYGYDVPMVSYQDWCAKMEVYVAGSNDGREEHALLPLFHFVTGDLPTDTIAPELDGAHAAAALRADARWTSEDLSGGAGVSVDTVGKYLSYLVATGFLPPPGKKGDRELPVCELSGERKEALRRIGGRGGKS